jgi:uncharacterized membrane protein YeaQ/YmgE (transglycosylase-associated protein family)
MSLIRQVFGTTHPKDIWRALIAFETIAPKPVVHITYWMGLGIFLIITFGLLGAVFGSAISEPFPKGVLLGLPILIVGFLGVLIGLLVWRGFCEFFWAVLTIAEDLKFIRQAQERYEAETKALQDETMAQQSRAPDPSESMSKPSEDPFFQSKVSPPL